MKARITACIIILFASLACSGSRDDPGECVEANCTRCHGSEEDPAPPSDTSGNQGTEMMGVGAHRSHLEASDWHSQIACTECHVVPGCLDDVGHIDTPSPAEMTWGDLATADGADPLWQRSDATCSGVYCHGATLDAGGAIATPRWTIVDGSQAACGSCHGVPPDLPHAPVDVCSGCHGSVVDADMVFVDPSLHVNGRLDF
jgi:predicted CxxxxCH...CXXCH cytochrome family protein